MADGDFTGTSPPPDDYWDGAARAKERARYIPFVRQMTHDDGRYWALSVLPLPEKAVFAAYCQLFHERQKNVQR